MDGSPPLRTASPRQPADDAPFAEVADDRLDIKRPAFATFGSTGSKSGQEIGPCGEAPDVRRLRAEAGPFNGRRERFVPGPGVFLRLQLVLLHLPEGDGSKVFRGFGHVRANRHFPGLPDRRAWPILRAVLPVKAPIAEYRPGIVHQGPAA
ncbi:MAG: hypothetical protein GVY13_14665 [Alphaproteobacteria bacterium]|nr:hypothetical protein [Alphaproteobacteria bacterium]